MSIALEPLDTLGPDYAKLRRSSGNQLPFCLHEWHLAWCNNLLGTNGGVSETPMFYVIRDSLGVAVGVFPFIHSLRRIGMLQIVSLEFLGPDPALTEIRGPLIAVGCESVVLQIVREELAKRQDWDWIQWASTSEPLIDGLRGDARLGFPELVPDFMLDLPATWDEFRGRLKRNIRESLRHCYNSLKRGGHSFELRVTQEPGVVHDALRRFLELHVKRANMHDAPPHAHRFASEVSRAFLFDVCTRLAHAGVFRMFELEIDGKIVAARIGFVVGDSLYLYYSGFDPEWRKFSVMTTLVAETVKHAIKTELKTINLSPTADVAKTRWGPRTIDYYLAFEIRPRFRSRAAHRSYRYLRTSTQAPARLLRLWIKARRDWK